MADVVGLRVRNANRVFQIDGEYQNLELVSAVNYRADQKDNDILGFYKSITVPPGRARSILAVCSVSPGVYYKKMDANTWRVYGTESTLVGAAFTAYIFAEPDQGNLGGVGLIVRSRLTGQVVFNSNKNYMRVLGMVSASFAMGGSQTFNFSGKKIALVQCVRQYGRQTANAGPPNQPIGVYSFWSGTIRTPSESQFVLDFRAVASATGGAQGNTATSMPSALYMVVDVTGVPVV